MSRIDNEERLAEVLSAIGKIDRDGSEPVRCISVSEESGGIDAILRETEQTILRRILSFRASGGELMMDVCERRVLCVTTATGDWTSPFNELVGRPLSRADAPELSKLISAFAEGTARVEVNVRLPDQAKRAPAEGIAVEQIRSGGQLNVEAGFGVCAELAMASVLVRAGAAPETSGDPDVCTKLKAICDACDDTGPVVIWTGGLTEDIAVAVFKTSEFDGTFAFPGDHLSAVLEELSGRSQR